MDTATGIEGYFARALAAGIPFTPGQSQWWDLPGPVRDYLVAFAAPDPAVLRRAAADYSRRGQLGAAIQLLLASGEAFAAAELLADGDLAAIEALDVLEFQAAVDRLPAEAAEAHPTLLLNFAMTLETAQMDGQRTEVLDRLTAISWDTGAPCLIRAIEIERASDMVRDMQYSLAEASAGRVLAASGPGELLTRARAYSVLGRAKCWRLEPDGRRDLAALQEAEQHLDRADRMYDQLGMRVARAGLIPFIAMWIKYVRGEAAAAVEVMETGLALVADRPRRWAYLLIWRAEISIELGRHDRCEADVREILRVADNLPHAEILRAYSHWLLAIAASHRRDAEETLEQLRLTEAHQDRNWWAQARRGVPCRGGRLPRPGRAQRPGHRLSAPGAGGSAGCGATDRHVRGRAAGPARGPSLAEEKLLAAPMPPGRPAGVLADHAAARLRRVPARGGKDAGALAARAFEEAARLGLAHLPFTKEGMVTGELLGLAVETGQPAALALEAAALPVYAVRAGPVRADPGRQAHHPDAGQGHAAAEDGGRIRRAGSRRRGHRSAVAGRRPGSGPQPAAYRAQPAARRGRRGDHPRR